MAGPPLDASGGPLYYDNTMGYSFIHIWWACCHLPSHISVIFVSGMARIRSPLVRTLNPVFILISIFWTFWNRTWLQARRGGMRIKGQKESRVSTFVYLPRQHLTKCRAQRIQFLIWLSRLVMSSLVSFWGSQITEGTFGAFLAIEVAVSLGLSPRFVTKPFLLVGSTCDGHHQDRDTTDDHVDKT